MSLAQDEDLSNRFYSLSSQVMAERTDYYKVLNLTSSGTGDVTGWLKWFLGCMSRSLLRSPELLSNVMQKKRFWQRFAQGRLNDRQSKAVNRLLDAGPGSFEGGMTNRKYAGLNHTSRATAQRELAGLMAKGILRRNSGGGRSISYDLNWESFGEDID